MGNTNLGTEVNSGEEMRGIESRRGTQRPPFLSAMCYLFLKRKEEKEMRTMERG